jgi:hypothetical protein
VKCDLPKGGSLYDLSGSHFECPSKLSDALSYEHKLLLRRVPVYASQDKEQDFFIGL